jgi:hypothetical protein
MMRHWCLLIGLVLLAGLLLSPAAAFTMNSVDITIRLDGDAEIVTSYSLSWIERVMVYMRIAQPEKQLGEALEQYSGKDVRVISLGQEGATIEVDGLARVNGTTYTTPTIDFPDAEKSIRRYWFSRFVTIDVSPDIVTMRFPDGYTESFHESKVIPRVTHETGT